MKKSNTILTGVALCRAELERARLANTPQLIAIAAHLVAEIEQDKARLVSARLELDRLREVIDLEESNRATPSEPVAGNRETSSEVAKCL
jgi:hypothetical protein